MGNIDNVKNARKRVNANVSYIKNLTETLEEEVEEAGELEEGLREKASAYTGMADEVKDNGAIAKNLLNVLKP